MSREYFAFRWLAFFVLPLLGLQALYAAQQPSQAQVTNGRASNFPWQSAARLHHGLRSTQGDLIFTADGIQFRSAPQFEHRWTFTEVKTFHLSARRLVLDSYENRRHHLPGVRQFHFDLDQPMPAAVAAQFANSVGKPAVNADTDGNAEAFLTIPARHGTRFGGTNGMLRFREQGIDYVTTGTGKSRSWRWNDIQTVANPDPYHFRVGSYLEAFDFKLKQPLPRDVFDRLWDRIYARDLNVAASTQGGERHADR